jgi:hypothetical protein
VPALLSSLIDVPAGELSGVLAAGGVPHPCLGEWLGQVPDPGPRWAGGIRWGTCWGWRSARSPQPGTIPRSRSPSGRRRARRRRWQPWTGAGTRGAGRSGRRAPRTFSRVFARIDAAAFNAAVHGYLHALDRVPAGPLPQITAREREQRRAAKAGPAPAGLLPQVAADGKTMRGRPR